MKILLVTLEYPPQKGGVASYYGGLVKQLKRQGHEVEVVANAPTPPSPPSGRGGKLLSRWIWPRWMKGYFLVRKRLKMYGGKASPMAIGEALPLIFVGQILPLGTVAYLLRKRAPYVVFAHGMDILMAQKSWRKQRLMKKILGHAKLVLVNSEFTKQQIEVSGVRCQVIVVYPCPTIVPDVKAEDVELMRRKLGLTGKKVLLTLGRVVERKGHDLVLKAMPEILKHVPEAVYVVVGDGPDLGRLQQLAGPGLAGPGTELRSGTVVPGRGGAQGPALQSAVRFVGEGPALQSAVRFVGEVSDEERPLYYALCDLFVMPSRQIGPDVEGFGLSFLEAAVFGKPSVGGRSGGQDEAILDGKTGALVDTDDSSALARVCVQLLNNEALRNELGKNAKARVVHEFRWEKQAGKLVSQL